MKLTSGGSRRQEALPAVMVGACAVLAACGLAAGELTQPDDTTAQTINPTETTQTTIDSTETTQTADPTATTETTLDPTGTTQTTIDAPTTTQTADPTETQTTIGSAETEVTLAPPGVAPPRKDLTFPVMIAAPGGFLVGEPGAENAVKLGDAKEMLERGALSIAYDFWGLLDDAVTRCPAHRLRVTWEWPDHVFGPDVQVQVGAYIPPLGPPRVGEDRAAGIVYCKGSEYGYMGFDAVWKSESKAWAMHPIPEG